MSRNITKLRKNLLGLDIGASSLKLLLADINKEGVVIKKFDTNPLPENIYSDGEITNMEAMIKVLKQTLKKNKIKAKDCFCCVDSSQIISREVTIPNINKENLQEMAQLEVEQYLPIEMENYLVQSLVVREIELEDKPLAEMLVTAFPTKFIRQLHTVIQQSGLRPVVLDTQANAFGKLVEAQSRINGNDFHKDSLCAFLDLGYESINIHIFYKGKFRFSRILHFGGRDLDTNIAKFMDLTLDEARLKKLQIHNINYSVDESSADAKALEIVKSTLDAWLDEVNKIFRYYYSRNSGTNSVEYIYIYGGLSRIEGLSDYIESHFKVPTSLVKKISNIEVQPSMEINEVLNTIGVFYRR